MRKVKLQMQLSLDGYVAGPNGEMDWMIWNWSDDVKKYVSDLTEPVDTILLGRNMTTDFISHWKAIASNPEDKEYTFAKKFYDTPKVAFSKKLKASDNEVKSWDNTTLATGDVFQEIESLKKQSGNDIIVYGGANFVANLTKQNLIDEYHLFINPVVIGEGLSIFKERDERLNLKLLSATPFDCGIVALAYCKV